MSERTNNNSTTVAALGASPSSDEVCDSHRPPLQNMIQHLYVHIPFCARICPYCAFYKDLLDRSQTNRFCQALLRELDQHLEAFALTPSTIYFGGGTPTALTTSQLEYLLAGFHERLDLSRLTEWTVEANPGAFPHEKPASLENSA